MVDEYVIRGEDAYDLLFLLIPSRWAKCGYKKAKDCVSALTWRDLQFFRERVAWHGSFLQPNSLDGIQYLDVGDKRIFGIGGLPQQIARKLNCHIHVSERVDEETYCLFVLVGELAVILFNSAI